jgi:hypothetical protein
MTRDELIKEIHQLPFDHPDADIDEVEGIIADFVIAKQTAILSEIEKPLEEVHDMDNLYCNCCEDTNEAIDEALSIIQRIRGDK